MSVVKPHPISLMYSTAVKGWLAGPGERRPFVFLLTGGALLETVSGAAIIVASSTRRRLPIAQRAAVSVAIELMGVVHGGEHPPGTVA